VVAPDALLPIAARTAHPLRALLWLLVALRKRPAQRIVTGGGYRASAVPTSAPASGDEGVRFEAAGLRYVGVLHERAVWMHTTSDVHIGEDGATHAYVRQTPSRAPGASTLSTYYVFSVLTDGTVVETVQSPRPYLTSTERYVCFGGTGDPAADVDAHRRNLARICRERGVQVVAARELDDVVLMQRVSYRFAMPLVTTNATLLVLLAPVAVVVLLLAAILAFFR
jgi:hypothetical protein